MPTFSFTVSNYTPFTKILSANINSDRADLITFLNTTKIDDTNIQNSGITPTTKLNQVGSVAGQFLGSNGSTVVWASNPLTAQFNTVLGSAAQVTAGTATNSTFASITQADGMRILVLPGYATNEAWAVTNKLYIQGLGNTCIVQGAITFGTGSSYSSLIGIQTQSNLTINSGITGVNCEDVWFSGTNTFEDNNSTASNYLAGFQG